MCSPATCYYHCRTGLGEELDVSVWRNALDELKLSYTEIQGMDDYVFPRLKFSYDRLSSDKIKACFLYCALFPEDHTIEKELLFELWLGDGLIDEVGNLGKEKNKGHAILRELKDACLVEYAYQSEMLKFHDLIRDLAINITKGCPRFIAKAGEQLKESPRLEEWTEDTERISLMNNQIEVLSSQPICPKLSTLLLQGNNRLQEISDSFFKHMQGLRVLDLSCTAIQSLSESFSQLRTLRVLLLTKCSNLDMVPSLARMKQLRVLNLRGTPIIELPEGMKELVELRYLNLSDTGKLKIFPYGIIPELQHLEQLLMDGSACQWSSNKEVERAGADIEVVVGLKQLASLSLSIADGEGFLKFFNSQKWRSLDGFHISVGNPIKSPKYVLGRRMVEVNGTESKLRHFTHFKFPSNTNNLVIKELDRFYRLSEFLANVIELEYCEIEHCNCIKSITMANENNFSTLQTLILIPLPSLKSLCYGDIPLQTFANLKILQVLECHHMDNLFTLGSLQNLPNLEEIKVEDCLYMEDIVADDGIDVTITFALPKLKKFRLIKLPKLKSIWRTTIICTSLEYIVVRRCSRLKKLLFCIHSLPNLKQIRGTDQW